MLIFNRYKNRGDYMITKCFRFGWLLGHSLHRKVYFSALDGFLSVVSGEKVTTFEARQSTMSPYEKSSARLNICAKNERGECILFQIQTSWGDNYTSKMLSGISDLNETSKVYFVPFNKASKVISINIVYTLSQEGNACVSSYMYPQKDETAGQDKEFPLLKKIGDIVCPDLATEPLFYVLRINEHEVFNKYSSFYPRLATPIDEWIYYLQTGDVFDSFTAAGLPEIREYFKISSEELVRYNEYLKDVQVERSVLSSQNDSIIAQATSRRIRLMGKRLEMKVNEYRRRHPETKNTIN
jgi:hypothetical protein